MTYAQSLSVIPSAIARVRFFSPDGTPCEVVTCYSPEAILYAVNQARYSDTVKVQVL